MKIGIIGSGFGLYGYLPAVCECGFTKVYLPKRYQQRLAGRSELQDLVKFVHWVEDEIELYSTCQALIIAKRPHDQFEIVQTALKLGETRFLLLEKPIASSPQMAQDLLRLIEKTECIVQSGLYFDTIPWAETLKRSAKNALENTKISINWHFQAHHYAHDMQNWKRNLDDGGGALRFFGIHFVSVMAACDFSTVKFSRVDLDADENVENWHGGFVNPQGVQCDISICSNASINSFDIDFGNGTKLKNQTPFDDFQRSNEFDIRVPALQAIIKKLLVAQNSDLDHLKQTNDLWAKLETKHI